MVETFFMRVAIRIYRLLNILSLDVVVGAWASALFFGRLFFVPIGPPELIALGLTVWIIYTTDHLRDARRMSRRASTERHRFHQKYYKPLLGFVVVLAILDTIAIGFIPGAVLIGGIILMMPVAIYLLTHQWLRFLKELCIAIMYTGGVLLPSLPLTGVDLNRGHYLLIVLFIVLALINLLMFSWFDREVDQKDQHQSFVTLVGDRTTRIAIWMLIALEVSVSLAMAMLTAQVLAFLLLACMGIALLTIFAFRRPLARNDYYRLLGDAVFLLPFFYWI